MTDFIQLLLLPLFLFMELISYHNVFSITDLTSCCTEGRRVFAKTGACPLDMSANVRSVYGSACSRAAAVCCLASSFDTKCSEGENRAQNYDVCVSSDNLNDRSVGFERQCCECCLLAKQAVNEGKECDPLPSFDSLCRRSFEKCCSSLRQNDNQNASYAYTYASGRTASFFHPNNVPNRCWTDNPCQQLCEVHGDGEVRCACKSGYRLNEDRKTCADINECEDISSTSCTVGVERCVNTEGSYDCVSMSHCPTGMTFSNGNCVDIDECLDAELACDAVSEKCVNTYGSYECQCREGFAFNVTAHKCVDVDECVLERDNTCSVGQRCFNTIGSYKCIRTLSCGTGYYLDSETENCKDIDECALSTHNCGSSYTCRNTKGSFRCERRVCPVGQIVERKTGKCITLNCDAGFSPGSDGKCHDIDECGNPNSCSPYQLCLNTPGSYHCSGQQSLCRDGFEMDRHSGQCVDIDECARGIHRCTSKQNCRNFDGSYKCDCPPGYVFNQQTKRCDDIDECAPSNGNVCSFQATCENTPGSFRCKCNEGYVLAADQRSCEDVDECQTGRARCQQRCVNVPGSYQCICNRGFTVGVDGVTCKDIDECTLWSSQGASLCMGRCINTPGSYICECPSGYRSANGGRTCDDIDECTAGECQGDDHICVNTLGSFRCHRIQCPENYFRDPQYKNRCNRMSPICSTSDQQCLNMPMSISHNYISLPSNLKFRDFGLNSLPLFTMKGPRYAGTHVQFELILTDVVLDGRNVRQATRNSFQLQKGPEHNTAIVALNEPLPGPQDVYLDLLMRVQHNNVYGGRAVAKLVVHVSEQEEFLGQ